LAYLCASALKSIISDLYKKINYLWDLPVLWIFLLVISIIYIEVWRIFYIHLLPLYSSEKFSKDAEKEFTKFCDTVILMNKIIAYSIFFYLCLVDIELGFKLFLILFLLIIKLIIISPYFFLNVYDLFLNWKRLTNCVLSFNIIIALLFFAIIWIWMSLWLLSFDVFFAKSVLKLI
jgi:hypothetical protein